MEAQTPLIVTDQNAFTFMIWVIGLLGSATLGLTIWFVKKIFAEIKLGRTDMVDFTNELKHKFRTLNNYAKEHERRTLLHSEKLSNLDRETQDYKKKTDEHSAVLARHGSEIDFLKRGT